MTDTATTAELATVTDADYHADFDRLSCSMAKVAKDSLSEFHAIYVARSKPPKAATKVMDVGSIAHDVLLSRKEFSEFVGIYPDDCLKSNGAINPKPAREWEDVERANGLEYFLKAADAARVQEIIAAVKASIVWSWISKPTTLAEQAIFWECRRTGLLRRCKPDFLMFVGDQVFPFDLKITGFWTPDAFRKQIRGQSWWLQQPFYGDGIAEAFDGHDIQPFRFVAVNPEPPYQIACHELSQASADEAGARCDALLDKLSAAYEADEWLDECQVNVNQIELSKWDFE